MDAFAHVHHRIAEQVTRDLGVDVSEADVYEILSAGTLGWPDGVVAAIEAEAKEYGIDHPSPIDPDYIRGI